MNSQDLMLWDKSYRYVCKHSPKRIRLDPLVISVRTFFTSPNLRALDEPSAPDASTKASKKAHWKRNSKVRSRITTQASLFRFTDEPFPLPTVHQLCRLTHRLGHWRKRRRRLCLLLSRKVRRIRPSFWRRRRCGWQCLCTSNPANA